MVAWLAFAMWMVTCPGLFNWLMLMLNGGLMVITVMLFHMLTL